MSQRLRNETRVRNEKTAAKKATKFDTKERYVAGLTDCGLKFWIRPLMLFQKRCQSAKNSYPPFIY